MIDNEERKRLVVIYGEGFEIDLDSAFLFVGECFGADVAEDWRRVLAAAINALPDFPGPRANAIDDEASRAYGYEVRRFLYYGSLKRRPLRIPYRILYTIIEPEDSSEGFIRVLRLIHGSRPLLMPGE